MRDLTDGHLPDVVIDATGSERLDVGRVRPTSPTRGRLVFVGITTEEVRFRHPVFHRSEGTLLCSRNALLGRFHADHRADRAGQDRHRIPGSRIARGFEELIDVFPSYTRPETGVIKAVVEVGTESTR